MRRANPHYPRKDMTMLTLLIIVVVAICIASAWLDLRD
jgi:hypothetical protein